MPNKIWPGGFRTGDLAVYGDSAVMIKGKIPTGIPSDDSSVPISEASSPPGDVIVVSSKELSRWTPTDSNTTMLS